MSVVGKKAQGSGGIFSRLSILVTEKTTLLQEGSNQYTLVGSKDLTKDKISALVCKMVGVKPLRVNSMNVKGDSVVFKGRKGVQKSSKKFVVLMPKGVTLKVGGE